MKILVSVPIILVLASLPALAVAQVTQSYSYDGNGRMTGVSTTGSGGTNTAAYTYDDADNRTSRSQTGTTAYAAILSLPVGEPLLPTHALVSADGRYSLAMRTSGALELWRASAEAHGASPSFAGLFQIDRAGAARFNVPPSTANAEGASLSLSDVGDLVMIGRDGDAVVWRATLDNTSEVSQ